MLIKYVQKMKFSTFLKPKIAVYSDQGVDSFSQFCTINFFSKIYPKSVFSKLSATHIISGFLSKTPKFDIFIMPGGADLPYCNLLNGQGNQYIQEYVKNGGIYIGICAGAYYASNKIIFAKNTPLEVSGNRELKFFKGNCIGPINEDFQYGTHETAKFIDIFMKNDLEKEYYCYTNGGGYFENIDDENEIVAYGKNKEKVIAPIMVKSNIGKGKVLLSGVHYEFDYEMLDLHYF